jgi:hypothetical protein
MSTHSIAEERKQEWTNFKIDLMRYSNLDRNAENRLTLAILSVLISRNPCRQNFEPISWWQVRLTTKSRRLVLRIVRLFGYKQNATLYAARRGSRRIISSIKT